MFINRRGLGDIERKWQIEAEAPIRLAEIAQGVASGEIEVTGPDTPENRAQIANQFLNQATQKANELIVLAQTGIKYSADAPAVDPSADYQWLPGQTPSIQQAIAEIQYTRPIVAEYVAEVVAQAPTPIYEPPAPPPPLLTEYAPPPPVFYAPPPLFEEPAPRNTLPVETAVSYAPPPPPAPTPSLVPYSPPVSTAPAVIAPSPTPAASPLFLQPNSGYDAAYNAAIAAQQALRDLSGQVPGETYLSSTGGGPTMYPQGFVPVTSEGPNYLLWGGLGALAYFLTRKKA